MPPCWTAAAAAVGLAVLAGGAAASTFAFHSAIASVLGPWAANADVLALSTGLGCCLAMVLGSLRVWLASRPVASPSARQQPALTQPLLAQGSLNEAPSASEEMLVASGTPHGLPCAGGQLAIEALFRVTALLTAATSGLTLGAADDVTTPRLPAGLRRSPAAAADGAAAAPLSPPADWE
ncbi:unnamed protein product, partial [Symbiodinium sp. KB8]